MSNGDYRQGLADQLVIIKALTEVIEERDEELRKEARMIYTARSADAVTAGEIELGRVSRNRSSEGWAIDDWNAFRAWVEETVPSAIQRQVADWFVRDVRKTGTWTNSETGEVVEVPGVSRMRRPGNIVVEATAEARDRMRGVLEQAKQAIES
jgi:hypothetical protein